MNTHEKLNYVEFAARDLAATKAFFSAVFAWEFTDYGPRLCGLFQSGFGWRFF